MPSMLLAFHGSANGEHSWHVPILLDNDCQVHSLMNDAIQVIRTRGGKWTDLCVRAVDLHVVDGRRAWLVRRCGCAMLPGAVGENMGHGHVIHQEQLGAFGNGDRRLCEVNSTHMHRWDTVCIGR